ncbi:MAG: hypothetical protein ACKOOG_00125 [Actinomycetota bacterium]
MTPVSPVRPGPARLPDGVLAQVVIDAVGPQYRDADAEARAAQASQ